MNSAASSVVAGKCGNVDSLIIEFAINKILSIIETTLRKIPWNADWSLIPSSIVIAPRFQDSN